MKTFALRRADSVAAAVALGARSPAVRFLAGGTTLLDLMKLDVEQPDEVVQLRRLGLDRIEATPDGGLAIGALVTNSALAHEPLVVQRYPVLSEALLSGASVQLRNMATTAGNLLQRTRCVYFRDTAMACNKRVPGSGCAALGGYHRNLAVLGTSEHCIASNPSDMNVALTALDAVIHVTGQAGARAIPIRDFFLLPGTTPHLETVLAPGDLVTHVTLPPLPPGTRSTYVKLRDRASYEFALASSAVVLTPTADAIGHVAIALGGVGTVPWRASQAERLLAGQQPTAANFRAAAAAALQGARGHGENDFKVELAQRCLVHALATVRAVAGGVP
ncbi:FAD binding domain-containing protein [Pseudoduganella chitinolytica]|uniref:Xanthine dehydrogenase family protein subunit M n=1 Tax=Pseudoduganella chitinolytica TaxID=34070 RepID=A0ABY8BKC6_9BURK|nr:xanthine dehydrogenase family protein subunit M [Pseudoduganella chitinolytica]WEF34834.1 xanthine dehydrogenase family protein subunit M [Pseudoduganella chitinolytica]